MVKKKLTKLKKIFSYRTSGPISTKLSKKHPLVKGIQVCSNEGATPSKKGDNWELIEINGQFLKIFSISNELISIKPGTMHPWVKEIQFLFSNESPQPFSSVDNYRIAKVH